LVPNPNLSLGERKICNFF